MFIGARLSAKGRAAAMQRRLMPMKVHGTRGTALSFDEINCFDGPSVLKTTIIEPVCVVNGPFACHSLRK
jgi:hypothetical protein